MRKFVVYSLCFILGFLASYFLVFIGTQVYDLFPFQGNLWGLIVVLATTILIIKTLELLVNKASDFSTESGALYETLKKKFPYWSEVIMRDDYLFVSWKSLEGNVVHNYEFDFSINKAKIYDNGDVQKTIFEGEIKKVVSKMK